MPGVGKFEDLGDGREKMEMGERRTDQEYRDQNVLDGGNSFTRVTDYGETSFTKATDEDEDSDLYNLKSSSSIEEIINNAENYSIEELIRLQSRVEGKLNDILNGKASDELENDLLDLRDKVNKVFNKRHEELLDRYESELNESSNIVFEIDEPEVDDSMSEEGRNSKIEDKVNDLINTEELAGNTLYRLEKEEELAGHEQIQIHEQIPERQSKPAKLISEDSRERKVVEEWMGFQPDPFNFDTSNDLINRSRVHEGKKGDIGLFYKPEGKNKYFYVLVYDTKTKYRLYNGKDKERSEATKEFKEKVMAAKAEVEKSKDEFVEAVVGPIPETTLDEEKIENRTKRLSTQEKREFTGSLKPPENTIDRLPYLRKIVEGYDEEINKVEEEIEGLDRPILNTLQEIHGKTPTPEEIQSKRKENESKLEEKKERLANLEYGKEKVQEEIAKLETREQQVNDVKVLKRFKRWITDKTRSLTKSITKERTLTFVSVSSLLISVAGLVTTAVIAGRSALAKGAVSALKAGANASKKAAEYAAKAAKNAFGSLISAVASDTPGGNRSLKINIRAQQMTLKQDITNVEFID